MERLVRKFFCLVFLIGLFFLCQVNEVNAATLPAKISELYPDKSVQEKVKLEIGAMSVDQEVNQSELNNISILDNLDDVTTFENFDLLVNLTNLQVNSGTATNFDKLKDLNLDILYLDNINLNTLAPFKNMTNIQVFSAVGANIGDYSVLKNFNNLYTLFLNESDFSDTLLFQDSAFSGVIHLNLDNTRINNLNGIGNLNLNDLSISGNRLTSITELSNMSSIRTITMNDNNITDLSPLASSTYLSELRAENNKITTFNITNNVNISDLYLKNNDISDITFLNKVKQIGTLDLSDNKITGLGMSGVSFSAWNSVILDGNEIKDFTFLSGLSTQMSGGLNTLSLVDCNLDNNLLNSLPFFKVYSTLNLNDNLFDNINVLDKFNYNGVYGININLASTNITNLTNLDVSIPIISLNLSNLNISDYSTLNTLSILQELIIENNPNGDFDSINSDKIVSLTIMNSNLDTLDFLNDLHNINSLNISDNKISDLSILGSKYSYFNVLIANNNEIVSLEPLDNFNLRTLEVDGNKIHDIEEVTNAYKITADMSFKDQSIFLGNVSHQNNITVPLTFKYSDDCLKSLVVDFPNGSNGVYDSVNKEIKWTNVQANSDLKYSIKADFEVQSGPPVRSAKLRANSSGTIVAYSGEYSVHVAVNPSTTYTVQFVSNGGSAVADITGVTGGSTITKPIDPTFAGNTFDGWYRDNGTFNNEWNFATDTVTQDIILYAKWTQSSSPSPNPSPDHGNDDDKLKKVPKGGMSNDGYFLIVLLIGFGSTGIVLRRKTL